MSSIVLALPRLKEPMKEILEVIDLKKAEEGNKHGMWKDIEKYPDIDGAELVSKLIS